MQIQLKQVEIVEALKQYIANKGINLTGKAVDIKFTAGRKDAGLSADIVIEDANTVIPGFTDGSADQASETPVKPALSVVKSETPVAPAQEDPAPEVDEAPVAETKAPTTSLFG